MSIKATPSFSLADQLFNADSVGQLARALSATDPSFEVGGFTRDVLVRFPDLTLKARIDWMVSVLANYLPGDFHQALDVLHRALPPPLDPGRRDDDFGQFIWVVPGEFVARYGCSAKRFDSSLEFLRDVTMRFSAESAIRPFLRAFPEPTMAFVRRCAVDDHYHVRRLASEGIRPYLPWAQRVLLPLEQVIEILDLLHADTTRYVTRSVANALNDISKIDPELAVRTLKRWRRQQEQNPKELEWMLRHAMRTLMKQGHPAALALLGYPVQPQIELDNLVASKRVRVGGAFRWRCRMISRAKQNLKITLHIHFLKANGGHARKVFIVRDAGFAAGEEFELDKKQALKPMTTRTLYPGKQYAELVVNGVAYAKQPFDLIA